jgi:hypothetical protein
MSARRPAGVVLAVMVVVVVVTAPAQSAAAAPLRGVTIDLALDAEPLAADLPRTVPTIVRVAVPEPPTGTTDAILKRLDDVLRLYQDRRIQVVLALGTLPTTDTAADTWRQFVRAVAERARGRVVAYQVGEVRPGAVPEITRYVYLLRMAAVQIRSVNPDAIVLQGTVPIGETDWQTRVFAAGVAPYIDGVALAGSSEDQAAFWPAVQNMAAVVEREKPSATMMLGPIRLPDDPDAATARLIDAVLRSIGTRIHSTAFIAGAATLKTAFLALQGVTDLVGDEMVSLDETAADLRMTQESRNVATAIEHRLVYSLTGFQTFLVYWSSNGAPVDLEISVTNAPTPMVRDPIAGTTAVPELTRTGPPETRLAMRLPATNRPLIVDFNFGNASAFGATIDVEKEKLPRVEEIIFRHQQVQAAQDAVLQNYTAHVRIEQHFRPSAADAAYNLVTENRLFWDHATVEWEELSFELNGAKWTSNRPAFPLVQPEKVVSLPLDLRMDQDYTYRLDGVDTIDGRPAFAVRFDPAGSTRALYRGTVWIDRKTYVKLKIQAVETQLSGSVVSNDETQLFAPAGELQGRPVWLLTRLVSKQTFLIAGRNVLVERTVRLADFVLNESGFETERSAARDSNRIMYRDTDAGVRYLVKKGAIRVVSTELTTSARAFALGADIDPSFDYPLPIGGINILDFNFLKKDLQLALLYGGVIGLGNIQRAGLWGGKFDASVDFFGLAVKANDDVFDRRGKRSGERVNRIPFSTGMNLGYQHTAFQKLSAHYEFKYDAYFRDTVTAPDFVIPSSTATHGEGAGYEYRRKGYSLLANVAAYQRRTWEPWGSAGALDPGTPTFTRYDLGLSKDFIFSTFHTIHLNGTYFGGRRLDRFSMYQFGLFDAARMHGVPSAVRFAELGMFRGSYSFNVFDQYRLDLFIEHARGRRSELESKRWPVTGTGFRVNFRTPKSTILQVDFGRSFLPEIYRGAGSTVVQILLLKPL